jgi:hypothetical protein
MSTVGLTCAGLIYFIFRYVNGTVNEDIRLKIALWMFGDSSHPRWHQHIPTVFNSFFGDRTFSWQALRATAFLTIACGLLVEMGIFIVQPGISDFFHFMAISIPAIEKNLIPTDSPTGAMDALVHNLGLASSRALDILSEALQARLISVNAWAVLLFFLLVYNIPVEYFAVTKTRWLMKLAYREANSVSRLMWVLAADLLITICLANYSAAIVEKGSGMILSALPKPAIDATGKVLIDPTTAIVIKAFFYQLSVSYVLPFIHTVWMIVCVVMAALSKLFIWVSRRVPLLSKFLNQERIEKEPITLIGEFTAALCFLLIIL